MATLELPDRQSCSETCDWASSVPQDHLTRSFVLSSASASFSGGHEFSTPWAQGTVFRQDLHSKMLAFSDYGLFESSEGEWGSGTKVLFPLRPLLL